MRSGKPRRPLIEARAIEQRVAAVVRRADPFGAVSDQHIDRLLMAQEGRRVQGRTAVRADGVHIGAPPDEQLDGLGAAGDRRPEQRRPAAFGIHAVHGHPARQVPLDGPEVARPRGRPDVRPVAGRRRPTSLPERGRHRGAGDRHRGRDDREHPRQQGQEDPVKPVLDQRPAASPVQQHRAEEAAHGRRTARHPEAVDGRGRGPRSPSPADDPRPSSTTGRTRGTRAGRSPAAWAPGPQGVQVGSSGEDGLSLPHGRSRSPDLVRY